MGMLQRGAQSRRYGVHKLIERCLAGSAIGHRCLGFHPQLLNSCPHSLALFRHEKPQRFLQLHVARGECGDGDAALPPAHVVTGEGLSRQLHFNCNFQHIDHMPAIQRLVYRHLRPRYHGHARVYALYDRIPTAMRKKSCCGRMS
ncbi:hypothetical protein Mapa_002837 [Marchantia paleacea]|nr:hypothetical protein Mapa_002837 [Marchantia paleacea]